jgi:TIR domain
MPRITISYRRADSDAMTGRIHDRLASRYGAQSIFMDIDSIPLGVDFREHVKQELSKSDVLLAVVGKKWRGLGKGGHARLDEEDDPVRVELEIALTCGIRIVPVLVNGATMPKPGDLPESLRKFSFNNSAIIAAGQDFQQHMDRLMQSLDQMLGVHSASALASTDVRRITPHSTMWFALGIAAMAALLLGVGGSWLLTRSTTDAPSMVTTQPVPSTPLLDPAVVTSILPEQIKWGPRNGLRYSVQCWPAISQSQAPMFSATNGPSRTKSAPRISIPTTGTSPCSTAPTGSVAATSAIRTTPWLYRPAAT